MFLYRGSKRWSDGFSRCLRWSKTLRPQGLKPSLQRGELRSSASQWGTLACSAAESGHIDTLFQGGADIPVCHSSTSTLHSRHYSINSIIDRFIFRSSLARFPTIPHSRVELTSRVRLRGSRGKATLSPSSRSPRQRASSPQRRLHYLRARTR